MASESEHPGANPILRASKLARGHGVPTHTRHEALVDLTHESEGDRQRRQPGKPVLQGLDVVRYLSDVGDLLLPQPRGFKKQQVREGCLRALYPAGEHSLTPGRTGR